MMGHAFVAISQMLVHSYFDVEAGDLHLFWPRLQYSYEGRFRCRHIYVYIVHKVLLSSTTL